MSLFNLMDYKTFILEQIEKNSAERGYQKRLASAAKCHASYLSHVLHSDHHLHPDQAMGLCLFWSLSSEETDWFLELVNLARTQSAPLRRRIEQRLKSLKEKQENLSEKFQKPRITRTAEESLYYSSWHWSALHIITSIPTYRKIEIIADRLQLPKELVSHCLVKLEQMGLVKKAGSEWKIVPGGLFIPKEAFLSHNHHANWRHRALLDAQNASHDGIHYTYVASHSSNDSEGIKSVLLEAIERTGKIVRASPEEEISCVCLDWFRL